MFVEFTAVRAMQRWMEARAYLNDAGRRPARGRRERGRGASGRLFLRLALCLHYRRLLAPSERPHHTHSAQKASRASPMPIATGRRWTHVSVRVPGAAAAAAFSRSLLRIVKSSRIFDDIVPEVSERTLSALRLRIQVGQTGLKPMKCEC